MGYNIRKIIVHLFISNKQITDKAGLQKFFLKILCNNFMKETNKYLFYSQD